MKSIATDIEVPSLEESLILEHLNNRIKSNLKGHLSMLFPGINHEKDSSRIGLCRIDLNAQHWTVGLPQEFRFKTFADIHSGSSRAYSAPNGCFVGMYAKHYGSTLAQAIKEICTKLNVTNPLESWKEQNGLPGCTEEFAVPESEAVKAIEAVSDHPVFVAHGYKRIEDVPYKNPDGTIRCSTRIYAAEDRHLVTLTPHRSPDGGLIWAYGYPSKPCLYGLDGIAAGNAGAAVLITPDESTMLHLERNYKGNISPAVITTWPGGLSHGIDKLDFSSLSDKTVIIFPECSKKGFAKAGRLVKSLSKSSIRWVRVVSRKRTFEAMQSDQDVEKALASDLFQAFTLGELQPLEEFYRDAEEFFGIEPEWKSDLSQPVTWSMLKASSAAQMEWLIEGIIRKGERGLIRAPKQNGKTWLIMLICLLIVSGTKTVGGKPKQGKRLKVLLIDGENPVSVLRERLELLVESFGLPEYVLDQIDFHSAMYRGEKIDLNDPAERKALKPRLDAADVVILDNVNCIWTSAMSAQPEASAELNTFVNELSIKGKTVIVVTHTPRGGKGAFGSSTKEFGMDVLISPKGGSKNGVFGFRVEVESRSGEPTKPLEIALVKNADGKTYMQVTGGCSATEIEERDEEYDVIDVPASAPRPQEASEPMSEPVPEAEPDTTDTLSEPTATVSDVPEAPQITPDMQRTVEAASKVNLSAKQQFILAIYLSGITADRAIAKRTAELVDEGMPGAMVVPSGTVWGIIKKLKELGLIPSE